MSSSPFELFRRNLKPLMVLLTLLALFSFVVLPSIAMYQQRTGMMSGGDTKLASFDGGDFEINKVSYFTRTHYATVQFLNQLAETTIAQGGSPKVAGFRYNTQLNQVESLGINANPSDEASVRTMMFAGEAKKAGLELDDTAIRSWLTAYTDGRLTDAEINGVLQSATRNQLGQFHLYEQLRTQLLTEAFQRKVLAGLAIEGRPIVPPAQQWELFLRLNRRAVADAFAVNVSDFIEKTNAKPSAKEIERVFEEGKTRFPDDQSPLPAFRRPYQANFEYLAGSLDEFIAREVATMTEEQLRAEYQRRLDGGDFKLPEFPAEPPADPLVPQEPAEPAVPSEPAAAAAEEMKPEDTPAAEAPATEPPAEAQPADAKPAEAPATEPPAEAPAAEAPTPGPVPEPQSQSRRMTGDDAVRLVAARAQEPEAPAAAPDEPAAAPDEPAAAPDEPAAPADSPVDEPAAPAETPAPPADAPATEPPADEPAPAKSRPFEEVRDNIARSLALPEATKKLDAAVTEVNKTMRSYFNARAIAGDKTDKIPPRPDLKKLAEALGMTHVETGLVDARQLQEFTIRDSMGVGTAVGMQRGESFLQLMFIARPPMFAPLRTVDDQSAISFVSWKTEDKDAAIPTLREVREEVIMAIRTAEARRLAQAEAEKRSAEFNKSEKPIRELIAENQSPLLFESVGPFSWMNSFGFGMQAFMGNVEELDNVGEDFMRKVFNSQRGQWGVAPNAPQSVFYVVRPVEFSPSTDELYQRFTQMIQRFQASTLAVQEVVGVRDGFYEALDKKTGFKWNESALR